LNSKDTEIPKLKIKQPYQVDPTIDIYSAYNIIKILGLTQDPKRNLRKDKDSEQILMGLNLSAPVKLACFELGLVHP
jgi:hypothetical protein